MEIVMRRSYSTGSLMFLFIWLLIPLKGYGQTDTANIALTATVSTSFVSSWEVLEAVNDNCEPVSSGIKSCDRAYGNWNGEADYNKYNWVQYTWPFVRQITSTSVYWWDDGAGIDQPTDAYIEYWDGAAWVNAGQIGTALDTYNSLKLDLNTSQIRINMKSAMATGILEWRVYGVPCDQTAMVLYYRVNNGEIIQGQNISGIEESDSLQLLPETTGEGTWEWSGPGGFSSTSQNVTLKDLSWSTAGTYTVEFRNECGAPTKGSFSISVRSDLPITWQKYDPGLSYDFRDEFPALSEPTQDLDDCAGVVGTQSSGWWVFKWGANANPLVSSAAITPMLQRMNTDFAYFRNVMGWPPDKRAKNGYFSAIYLYGSGLCTDNASNTDLGGWQSAINGWPMVLISYYPVYCFDPSCTYNDIGYQTGAVVHEGIHSVLADLPGCKQAAWFQEGGNTWLQQEADATRSNNFSSMGFLNGASMIAPFMPIECYSGWLQDDSFGGPSAEGVNMSDGSTQICTWRNLLGGVQYSNLFPTFLGMTLGNKSIPWIWRYATGRVLEGMAEGLGDTQIRRLIMEYRAKQALLDMGKWTGAIKNLLDSQFGLAIKPEWSPYWIDSPTWIATPYAKTSNNGSGLLTPEYRTTPGWSGANQIPLIVNGDYVTVDFQPLGVNMTCQLCYRTPDGQTVYGTPVSEGECSLKIEQQPANDVIFAVITNTEYIYKGEETRKAHYNYKLQLISGISGTADINKKWYDWTKVIPHSVGINDIEAGPDLVIYPNPVEKGQVMNIDFTEQPIGSVDVKVMNLNGQVMWQDNITGNGTVDIAGFPGPGIYIASFTSKEGTTIKKFVVK